MKPASRLALAVVVAASTLAPTVAFAEAEDPVGHVVELEVNHTTAEKYLQWHGRIILVSKKATTSEYRWGGTACGSRVMPVEKVALLQRALEAGLLVIPRYQEGQGASKCLVGFRLLAN